MGNGKVILVAGATGRQGGASTRHLLKDGWHVRALTRHPDSLAARELAALGAELFEGDLTDRASLDRALRGVYGVHSVETFREAGFEGEVTEARNLADAAKDAGVQHFVYDSVVGAGNESDQMPWVVSKRNAEAYVRDLQLPWTIFRPCTFMENLLGQREGIADGVLKGMEPPDGIRQLIAVDDIGKFVALAFRERGAWLGKTTVIAGDRMTSEEMAERLGAALGGHVRYEQTKPQGGTPAPPKQPYEWADIDQLCSLVPDLHTLEEWAREQDWVREPTGASR